MDPTTVQMPVESAVVLWDGHTAVLLTDRIVTPPVLHPVTRAVAVARLRAVADLLERS